jgi:glycosyltransferase involved in cell wall biosynthesis
VERDWAWRLLFVGRVVAEKGVASLVKALPLLPPATTLEVVGHASDHQLDQMKQLTRDLGVADQVRFSRSPREELPSRYGAADLLVFPSEWPEPFGIVPLEAMACGVPVIATGTGGSGEFLEDGVNCVLFPPRDPPALAAAVQRVANDPVLRRHIVAGGSKTAAHLTMDRYAEELERLHHLAVSPVSG